MISKTQEERATRDLDLQRMIGEFITTSPKVKPGWVFISPAMAKGFLTKILKLYPEVNS